MTRFTVEVAILRKLAPLVLCAAVLYLDGAPCRAEDSAAHGGDAAGQRPRLVVLLMVDQLRGDLPLRYAPYFGPGGFRYLMERGVWYTAARHPHSHTETVVGHTTVSTGAFPAAHGMIGNSWFRRPVTSAARGEEALAAMSEEIAMGAFSTGHGGMEPGWLERARTRGRPVADRARDSAKDGEDGTDAGEGGRETAEVDDSSATVSSVGGEHTIVGTSTAGASPEHILTTTFADELVVATAQAAKAFSVSIKDRAAVALAGHSGKAFWFDSNTGQFVSSTYYYSAYPDWVRAWNGARHADAYSGESWTLSHPRSDYLYGEQDDRPWEPELLGYGRVFPHPFGDVGSEVAEQAVFYTKLTISPVGDELTLGFARSLVENEGLGSDEVTDFLGVSLSCNDIIGHWYGPTSLESEVSIRALDRNLAGFFAFLDATVGLEHTVIALVGDHGIPEVPELLETLRVPTGRVSEDDIESFGRQALAERYPNGERLLAGYEHPYFYLDASRIRAAGLKAIDVERDLAERLGEHPAILFAVSARELRRGGEGFDEEMLARIRRNQNPDRSGDVYVVQATQWQVGQPPASDEPVVIVNHGSPWAYDTYVPIAFAGQGIAPRVVDRDVSTVDVAATLALLTGSKPPSASVGSPLPEVTGSAMAGSAGTGRDR